MHAISTRLRPAFLTVLWSAAILAIAACGASSLPVVEERATAETCTSCHGLPPPAPHVASPDCGLCHPESTSTAVSPTLHLNGVVDVVACSDPSGGCSTPSCASCHGVPPGPPHVESTDCGLCHPGYASWTVPATLHQNGVVDWDISGVRCDYCHGDPPATTPSGATHTSSTDCGSCHVGYTSTTAAPALHLNGVVDLACGGCGCVSCHGNPPSSHVVAPAGSGGTGNFTQCGTCHVGYAAGVVDPTRHQNGIVEFAFQATSCGVCHGRPPPAPHVQAIDCGSCHVGYTSTTVPLCHANPGMICLDDPVTCTSCHGNPPPTTHLVAPAGSQGTGGFGSCGQCHPATSLSSGGVTATHRNGVEDVVLGTASCTVCHAGPPTTSHAPASVTSGGTGNFATCGTCHTGYTATTVPAVGHRDGTEQFTLGSTSCGVCHGNPPPAPHSTSTACGTCHTGYTATTVNPATHRNGYPDPVCSCSCCHAIPPPQTHAIAPPGSGGTGNFTSCGTCHPANTSTSVGPTHQNGTADYALGTTSCAICHGAPPPAPHPARTDCATCHPAFWATGVTLWTHRNGIVEVFPPVVSATPNPLDLGSVAAGASRQLTVTVANGGGADLVVSGVTACAGMSAEFAFPAGGFTLAAGATRELPVTYAPDGAGTDSGCLALASNDAARNPYLVNLTGTGTAPPPPVISATPNPLDFGYQARWAGAKTLALAVANTGGSTLSVTRVARCSGTTSEFSVSPATLSVAPGGSQSVAVSYDPEDTGADAGCVEIGSNDPAQPIVRVNVTGTSVQPRVPAIRTSPTSLGFGTVTVGYSRSLGLTVSNTGTATLNVSGVARCSGASDEFRVSSGGFSVSPGSSRQISVTYRPSGWGTDSGCIAITSNDPARARVEVPVSGAGASGR